ncbi:hypothetical protein KP509_04G091000 [Ceratopteris richardii]|uniref:PLATZ transcription factor family protein n=1 Tax=Ceratopteris richardii TaxID=49495 RepID=A0A8T2V2V5_CERRI|nr:hypothetical protein KP509_04G091000 [Ceratopteris richardii]
MIRRYVYNDVIRLQEIRDFIDCALVQPYVINSAKVVFLKERPQLRPSKGQGNVCASCERSLQAAYRYCSVACMVEAATKQGEGITLSMRIDHQHCGHSEGVSMSGAKASTCFVSCKEREDEGQLSPNCILHGLSLNSPSLSWSTDTTEDANWDLHLALHAPASPHGYKKLNKSSSFLSPGFCGTSSKRARSLQPSKQVAVLCASRERERRGIMLPSSNRRKGKPRRSPFC